MIGAYLAEMGLKDEAIFRLTSTPPSDMLWLNVELAAKLDIKITNFTAVVEKRRAERLAREAAEKVAREMAEKVAREQDEEQQKRIVPVLADGTCPRGSAIEPFNRTYCVKDKT
jgi:hypothetical protein